MTGFFYQPVQFQSAVREAVKVHKKFVDPTSRTAKLWLADFLEKLESSDEKSAALLVDALRLSQLRVLAHYLPNLDSSPKLFRKVLGCLRTRPDEGVSRQLWGLLGRYCDRSEVISALEELRVDEVWSNLMPPDLPELPSPLVDGRRIAVALSRDYVDRAEGWLGICPTWRSLSPASSPEEWEGLALGRHSLRYLITNVPLTFERESPESIIRWVDELLSTHEEIRQFSHNYLIAVSIPRWSDEIVDFIVAVLGDPRLQPDEWRGLPQNVIDAVVLRINTSKLETFFLEAAGDRERFEFWKNFVADMGPRSEGRVAAGQGFFEFPGFGVVEFMEVGNAAYIYRTADYERMLSRKSISNYMLKDPDACITRILHYSGWPWRWEPQIRQLIARGRRGPIS